MKKKKQRYTKVYTAQDFANAKWIIESEATVHGTHGEAMMLWAMRVTKWWRQYHTAVNIFRKGSGLTHNEAVQLVWDILSTKGWSVGRVIREHRGKRKDWLASQKAEYVDNRAIGDHKVSQKSRGSKYDLRSKQQSTTKQLQTYGHGFQIK